MNNIEVAWLRGEQFPLPVDLDLDSIEGDLYDFVRSKQPSISVCGSRCTFSFRLKVPVADPALCFEYCYISEEAEVVAELHQIKGAEPICSYEDEVIAKHFPIGRILLQPLWQTLYWCSQHCSASGTYLYCKADNELIVMVDLENHQDTGISFPDTFFSVFKSSLMQAIPHDGLHLN